MRECVVGLLTGVLVGTAGCSSPTKPTPLPPVVAEAPRISCPSSRSLDSADGAPLTVQFDAPVASGGAAPVTVSCTPPSPSAFPVGTTEVTCTASDALQRTDSCGFQITVSVPPKLKVQRFVAFGDSITYGTVVPCTALTTGLLDPRTFAIFDTPALWASVVSGSYPSVLETQLRKRYTAQTPTVVNEGFPGESVRSPTTRQRLSAVLSGQQPQVLLLQEGVNDLRDMREPTLEIPGVADALRTLVRDARVLGVEVLLGTLLPERVGGCRSYSPSLIQLANSEIRLMAASEGVPIVDLYGEFVGQESTLLGEDGLHPTPVGYETMAAVFNEAIRMQFEVPVR